MVVSAAGAWAGRVAALAGAELDDGARQGHDARLQPADDRHDDQPLPPARRRRHHGPGPHRGDPRARPTSRSRIPTTTRSTAHEIDALIGEGEKLFPDLRRMRLLRAYAGVRPLYDPSESAGSGKRAGDDREISRAHVVIDHEARDGIANFVSIVGRQADDLPPDGRADGRRRLRQARRRPAVHDRRRTPCPARVPVASYYWLGDRLAEHEAEGGGDADLICECEFVTPADARPVPRRALAVQPGRRPARAPAWAWVPARARSAPSAQRGSWPTRSPLGCCERPSAHSWSRRRPEA